MKITSILTILFILIGCATHTGPKVTHKEIDYERLLIKKERVSLLKEINTLKSTFDKKLKENEDNVREYQQKRMNRMLKRIALASGKYNEDNIPTIHYVYPSTKWHIQAIFNPDVIDPTTFNAWTNGFDIWITEALTKICKNDDEVAAVLSHELAHIYKGHLASAYFKQFAGQVMDAFAPGSSTALLLLTPFTKEMEREADLYGIIVMNKARYDMNADIRFWKKAIVTHSMIDTNLGFLLQTHPVGSERIIKTRKIIKLINQGIDPIRWEEQQKEQNNE